MSSRSVAGWTNWSLNVTNAPREVAHPGTVGELAELITGASQAGRPVKPVGTGHAFNSIAATDGVQICLDRLTGMTNVDARGPMRARSDHRGQPAMRTARPVRSWSNLRQCLPAQRARHMMGRARGVSGPRQWEPSIMGTARIRRRHEHL